MMRDAGIQGCRNGGAGSHAPPTFRMLPPLLLGSSSPHKRRNYCFYLTLTPDYYQGIITQQAQRCRADDRVWQQQQEKGQGEPGRAVVTVSQKPQENAFSAHLAGDLGAPPPASGLARTSGIHTTSHAFPLRPCQPNRHIRRRYLGSWLRRRRGAVLRDPALPECCPRT